MGGLAAAYGVSAALTFGVTLGLVVWLRRHTRVGYPLLGAGAVVFVVSQLVHLPLNWALGHVLPSEPGWLWATSVAVGSSASLSEELARYAAIRWVTKSVRDTQTALMLGAGHGGVEALFIGGLMVLALVNSVILGQSGENALAALPPEQLAETTALLEQVRSTSPLTPLIGALERALVLPFHLAATVMVMASVVRKQWRWLLGAIAMHALLDGGMTWLLVRAGPLAAELWIGAFAVLSLGLLVVLGRRFRRPPKPEEEAAEPSGAPVELHLASKIYGGSVHALREATLTIAPGTKTCLLGPNGAGKTTTIRLLTGGVAPTSGHAWLFGKDALDDGFVEAKRRLGLVPQLPGMYDDLTVHAWLQVVRDVYGIDAHGSIKTPAEPDRALGLESLLDRPMGKLSGGQKRRVAIAAAVIAHPELLILDEPTAGLDPLASREVIGYLQTLPSSHTILLCTHDLTEAEELCDRVVVMHGGRVLVHEAIDALRDRVATQLELRISGDPETASGPLHGLGYEPAIEGETLVVQTREPELEAPTILRALLEADVAVVECRVLRPTLEQLFLDIVASVDAPPEASPAPAPQDAPLPPPVPLHDLWSPTTRRLFRKEWRQLRGSGSAFWSSLLLPVLFLLLTPQSLILSMGPSSDDLGNLPSLLDFGLFAEFSRHPERLALAVLPMFVAIAGMTAPTALITHSIVHERETRTLELLVALPVRIQQVIAAKLATAFLFAFTVCGVCISLVGIEMVVLGIANPLDVLALLVLSIAVITESTAVALLVALVARDFRTANNLAAIGIVPAIFAVMIVTIVVGGIARPLLLTLVFLAVGLAVGRVALRSATFERLLS